MKLRVKLAAALSAILLASVVAGTAYTLWSVHITGIEHIVSGMRQDTRWIQQSISYFPENSDLQTELKRLASATNYHITLYNSSGVMIASFPAGPDRSPLQHLRAGQIDEMLRVPGTVLTVNEQSDPKIRVYASMEEGPEGVRFFVIQQSRSDALKPYRDVRKIIFIALVISMILILVFSLVLAGIIARPLLDLTRDVEKVAGGNTGHEIKLKRSDEIGMLASSVRKMARIHKTDYNHLQSLHEKQRQFFADITHEIRNPLHTIMGSLEMLELPGLDDHKRKKYVTSLRNQAERIGRLFKDLMTLQRFDSDENFIIRKTVNMADITGTIAEWYYQTAESKGLELKIDTHPCMVDADPGKIEQVLDNLVSNAVKFTGEGSITVGYKQSGGKVEVWVSDTGIGIPEAHWSRLFDRFYRTDKARSRDKGGTGLGLSVVKSILTAHGTEIQVESEVGRGSRFFFVLDAAAITDTSTSTGLNE